MCSKINMSMPWTKSQLSFPSFSNTRGCSLSIWTLLNETVQYVVCFWDQFQIPDLGLVCLKIVYVIFFTEEAPSWRGSRNSYMAACQRNYNSCLSYEIEQYFIIPNVRYFLRITGYCGVINKYHNVTWLLWLHNICKYIYRLALEFKITDSWIAKLHPCIVYTICIRL
jgi:hypothetical protein